MFYSVKEPYFLILENLESNKRQKKETLRFSHRFFAYMHLSKRAWNFPYLQTISEIYIFSVYTFYSFSLNFTKLNAKYNYILRYDCAYHR